MSISANEKDLEIEDDLAKGKGPTYNWAYKLRRLTYPNSTKNTARPEVQDFFTIQEELRLREGC